MAYKCTHTSHWLCVIDKQQLLFAKGPIRTKELIYKVSLSRHTRMGNGQLLRVPRPSTNKLATAPIFKGIWNELPSAIRNAPF